MTKKYKLREGVVSDFPKEIDAEVRKVFNDDVYYFNVLNSTKDVRSECILTSELFLSIYEPIETNPWHYMKSNGKDIRIHEDALKEMLVNRGYEVISKSELENLKILTAEINGLYCACDIEKKMLEDRLKRKDIAFNNLKTNLEAELEKNKGYYAKLLQEKQNLEAQLADKDKYITFLEGDKSVKVDAKGTIFSQNILDRFLRGVGIFDGELQKQKEEKEIERHIKNIITNWDNGNLSVNVPKNVFDWISDNIEKKVGGEIVNHLTEKQNDLLHLIIRGYRKGNCITTK